MNLSFPHQLSLYPLRLVVEYYGAVSMRISQLYRKFAAKICFVHVPTSITTSSEHVICRFLGNKNKRNGEIKNNVLIDRFCGFNRDYSPGKMLW